MLVSWGEKSLSWLVEFRVSHTCKPPSLKKEQLIRDSRDGGWPRFLDQVSIPITQSRAVSSSSSFFFAGRHLRPIQGRRRPCSSEPEVGLGWVTSALQALVLTCDTSDPSLRPSLQSFHPASTTRVAHTTSSDGYHRFLARPLIRRPRQVPNSPTAIPYLSHREYPRPCATTTFHG